MALNGKPISLLLAVEFAVLFILIPLALCAYGTHLSIFLTLWGIGLYAFMMLRRAPDFSWKKLWHGDGWTQQDKRFALIRFVLIAALLTAITYWFLPDKFFRFPLDRFPLWFAVMVLYPFVSTVPQELCFRSFYFARYQGFLTEGWIGVILNGLLFGFTHIVLHNWIAPACCAIGGAIFASSYRQHRSLKWSAVEHSLYGCWIFTVGFGWYFFMGNWQK